LIIIICEEGKEKEARKRFVLIFIFAILLGILIISIFK